MAAKKNTPQAEVISDILKVQKGFVDCYVVGTSPLILNRMSEKAKHELLMPRGRKTATEKATTLKHSPVDEYRASASTIRDASSPTYLSILSTAFKGAIRTAALDMPGAKKAQIGRLTYIEGDYVGIYGVPKLFMSVTRSSDMNRTPDVRTRAIVPRWAGLVRVSFVQPLIRAQAVVNLLASAGITVGVGDWRPEKGAGSYGQFRVAGQDDPEFLEIVAEGSRQAQIDALETPVCYDEDTADLMKWYEEELGRRQLRGVA